MNDSLLRAFDPRKAHSPLSVAIDYGWFYKRSRRQSLWWNFIRIFILKEFLTEDSNRIDLNRISKNRQLYGILAFSRKFYQEMELWKIIVSHWNKLQCNSISNSSSEVCNGSPTRLQELALVGLGLKGIATVNLYWRILPLGSRRKGS